MSYDEILARHHVQTLIDNLKDKLIEQVKAHIAELQKLHTKLGELESLQREVSAISKRR